MFTKYEILLCVNKVDTKKTSNKANFIKNKQLQNSKLSLQM